MTLIIRRQSIAALILASLLLGSAFNANAELPIVETLGDAEINLPTPPKMLPAEESANMLRDAAEIITPKERRLLAYFVPEEVAADGQTQAAPAKPALLPIAGNSGASVVVDKSNPHERYLVVHSLRAIEKTNIDQATFDRLATQLSAGKQVLAPNMPTGGPNPQLKLTPGPAIDPVGIAFRDTQAIGILGVGRQINSLGQLDQQLTLSLATIMLINKRLVYVTASSDWVDAQDIAWVRKASVDYIQQMRTINH